MSSEKQIEEIDELTTAIYEANHKKSVLDYHWIATELYKQDYRKQEWISVEDRLPEDGVWVLGYSAKSKRGGLCNCLKSYVREFGNYDDTTHWLPLPEFPKEKGE